MRGNPWIWFVLLVSTTCAGQEAKPQRGGLVGSVQQMTCNTFPLARILLVNMRSLETQTTKAGEDGKFAFTDLKPGDYMIIVTGTSDKYDTCWEPQSRQVTIAAGKPRIVQFTLTIDWNRCEGVAD